MTMLTNLQPAITPTMRRGIIVLLARFRRALNGWVAAVLAHRERQAALYALRNLDDRELKDMCLYRGQIDEALEKAAQLRLRRRINRA